MFCDIRHFQEQENMFDFEKTIGLKKIFGDFTKIKLS